MAKTRITLTIDAALLRAVKVRAARDGKEDSEVIEEAVRGYLGADLLDKIWQGATLDEADANAEALSAIREVRAARATSSREWHWTVSEPTGHSLAA